MVKELLRHPVEKVKGELGMGDTYKNYRWKYYNGLYMLKRTVTSKK